MKPWHIKSDAIEVTALSMSNKHNYLSPIRSQPVLGSSRPGRRTDPGISEKSISDDKGSGK